MAEHASGLHNSVENELPVGTVHFLESRGHRSCIDHIIIKRDNKSLTNTNVIVVDFNNLLKDVELKTIEEIWPPGSSNKPWFKSKPWFTKDLLYLSKSQKIIMNVQKATGVCYRQELNKIRSEFRILKKNEITKLKNREREKLREKYKTCRLKFWKEIGRRKSKVANVNIDQDTLVGILTSEMERIELDQRIYTHVSVTDIATIMKELQQKPGTG